MSWSTSELRVRLAPLNRFKPSSKIFYWPFQGGTSFVDLLCFCSVLCLLCFVCVCLYVLCGHLLGKGWPLGSRLWCLLWVCHFPIGILGQVWYMIVSIPDLCTITYFYWHLNNVLIYKVINKSSLIHPKSNTDICLFCLNLIFKKEHTINGIIVLWNSLFSEGKIAPAKWPEMAFLVFKIFRGRTSEPPFQKCVVISHSNTAHHKTSWKSEVYNSRSEHTHKGGLLP